MATIPRLFFPIQEDLRYSRESIRISEWFAGMALSGLVAKTTQTGTPEEIAEEAFDLAEAMLAESVTRKVI